MLFPDADEETGAAAPPDLGLLRVLRDDDTADPATDPGLDDEEGINLVAYADFDEDDDDDDDEDDDEEEDDD